MIEVLSALLFLSFGIITLIFGLYGSIILYYGKFKNEKKSIKTDQKVNVEFEPSVSVVVPTHDEEMIISKKIENLLDTNYPKEKLELIFVDDSNDSTPDIVEEYSKRYPNIRLIKFQIRMGYSPSMIAGCKVAKGKIVVLNDAGSFLDSEAIPKLVANFQNPNIGLVTGKNVILNTTEEVGKSENLYQNLYNLLRTAETRMDSTFYVKGEATAVRKDLIEDLEKCGESYDTTLGFYVRQKGYKAVYDQNVKFFEYAPDTHSGRIKQKTIRAANLVKVLFRFRHMMFKRDYGKFGIVILPMNFAMLVIAPLMILVGFSSLLALSFFNLSLTVFMWSILGFVFLLALLLSRHLIITFIEFEYSLLKAIYQLIFTKKTHDKIDKVASTRRY